MLITDPRNSDNEEIKSYIKRAYQFGLDPEKIKNNLRVAGYSQNEIEKSFKGLEKQDIPFPPSPQTATTNQPPTLRN